MRIFISVVSHYHHEVIINLETLKNLALIDNVVVICRDNIRVKLLEEYCEKYNIHYQHNVKQKGFSENNNLNYLYYLDNFSPKVNDTFLVLNPDIIVNEQCLNNLKSSLLTQEKDTILGCNLFLDKEYLFPDENIRQYPKFVDFFKTYLLKDRSKVIDRSQPLPENIKYWVAGSAMFMKCRVYEQLQGFDEKYFLYCEDIDFCRRAQLNGIELGYVDNAKMIHFRRRESQRFLTRYFFWHVGSALKYTFSLIKSQPKKSSLTAYKANKNVIAFPQRQVKAPKSTSAQVLSYSEIVERSRG